MVSRVPHPATVLNEGESTMRTPLRTGVGLLLALTVTFAATARPGRAADGDVGPDPKEVQAVLDRAVAYLKKHQGEDGSYSPKIAGPGVTGLVIAGLIRNGVSSDDPVVAKGLAYMEKKVQADGGIYDKGLANYTTSVALMAFREANSKGKYDTVVKNATDYLKSLQFSDVDEKDAKFGGQGYDKKSRPDLSNTQLFLDAMQAAGVPKS